MKRFLGGDRPQIHCHRELGKIAGESHGLHVVDTGYAGQAKIAVTDGPAPELLGIDDVERTNPESRYVMGLPD